MWQFGGRNRGRFTWLDHLKSPLEFHLRRAFFYYQHYLMETFNVLAGFPSTFSPTSTSPRPIRLRGISTLT